MVSIFYLDIKPLEFLVAKKKKKTEKDKMIYLSGKAVWQILHKNYPSKYLLKENKTSVQNIIF